MEQGLPHVGLRRAEGDRLEAGAVLPRGDQADMIADVRRIMDKRTANKTVMPEEFTLLGKFTDLIQKRMIAARDQVRQQRLAEINAVRMTLPQAAFQVPLEALGLPEDITEAFVRLASPDFTATGQLIEAQAS